MTNGNAQKTFGWLVLYIEHNSYKENMRGLLAQEMDEYIHFCKESRFQEVCLAANNLKQALSANRSQTEIKSMIDVFTLNVTKFSLLHIEPGFLQRKVAMLKARRHNTALLFDISFDIFQIVMKSVLQKIFRHEKMYGDYSVNTLQPRDWLICDSQTATRVKSSGVKLGKVIVMDFAPPEADCFDHFLQLPVQLSDLQFIFTRENA